MARKVSWERQQRTDARLLLSGLCLFLAIMLGFPTIANLWYSFSDVSFQDLTGSGFVGIENYVDALTNPNMWSALLFSLRFAVVATVLQVVFALVLVFVLHPLVQKRPWLIAPLMLPMMVSPALMGMMYRLILNEFIGPVPVYLDMLGIYVNFLGIENVYATLVGIEVLQWTPFAFLVLLTARQSILPEVEEAAVVDGATGTKLNFLVILPMLLPTLGIVTFIRFIDAFRVFDHIFVLTGGGPGNQTTSISIYIYKLFFKENELGEAIALSVILLLASLLLLQVGLRAVVRRTEP
ncbi:multiple sugar transport system permease protein [Bauldia litoralis]|uniref:Multiple sugar transport system permease protein n=1 Tax=Bauldia litoralis TaxID=665467 RepID=A0A1G6EM62_9HYPH|nr:multiple sugar transport system permease protein [Bauldia litoralis]